MDYETIDDKTQEPTVQALVLPRDNSIRKITYTALAGTALYAMSFLAGCGGGNNPSGPQPPTDPTPTPVIVETYTPTPTRTPTPTATPTHTVPPYAPTPGTTVEF